MDKMLERQLIQLVATDRIDRPISSMSGKLKRMKKHLGPAVGLSAYGNNYQGERVHARIESRDRMKARGMSSAINVFCDTYKRHGEILRGLIAEKRVASETHLYFGMDDGRRLTADDYRGVMDDLGFTPAAAESLYGELMNVSHKIARKKKEGDRSILVG